MTFVPSIRTPFAIADLWLRLLTAQPYYTRYHMTVFDTEEATEAIRDGRARAFRLACGLSLRQAGKLIGVGRMTVYTWESSRRRPHPAIARAYLDALLARMAEDAL